MLWRAVYLHAAGRQPGTQRTDRPREKQWMFFVNSFLNFDFISMSILFSLMLFECNIHIVKLFMTVVIILRWKRANSWKEWQRLFSASAKTQRAHSSLTKSTHFHHKTIKNWEWKFDSERVYMVAMWCQLWWHGIERRRNISNTKRHESDSVRQTEHSFYLTF